VATSAFPDAFGGRFRLGAGAHPSSAVPAPPTFIGFCAGEISNVEAIIACPRRQKANLSVACAAVLEH
jgi:hypothetical protein